MIWLQNSAYFTYRPPMGADQNPFVVWDFFQKVHDSASKIFIWLIANIAMPAFSRMEKRRVKPLRLFDLPEVFPLELLFKPYFSQAYIGDKMVKSQMLQCLGASH